MHSRETKKVKDKKIKNKNAKDIKNTLLLFITFSYLPAFRRKDTN
jgi:hypothetical protein